MSEQTNQSQHAASRRRLPGLIPASIILVILPMLLTTAIRIEILNADAEYYLPRHDEGRGNGASGKWRWWVWEDEAAWIRTFGPRDEFGQPAQRALTDAERVEMTRSIRTGRAINALHRVVESWGVLQYLFVALVYYLAAMLLLDPECMWWTKRTAIVGIVVATAAFALASYRAYLESLGW